MGEAPLAFLVLIALAIAIILVIPSLLMGVLQIACNAVGLVVAGYCFFAALIGLILGTTPARKERRP